MKKIKSIDLITFKSEIVSETSMSSIPTSLGKHTSTMELFHVSENRYCIEWDIPTLDETYNIGIWVEDGTKTVTEYDGVFELPEQAVKLLQNNGFNTDDVTP
jgi:hypothetical protein